MEDIEPELKDFTPKNVFKTPRKKQRLSGYDQNSFNISKLNDSESIKTESVSSYKSLVVMNFIGTTPKSQIPHQEKPEIIRSNLWLR